jgi:hypothetical protein
MTYMPISKVGLDWLCCITFIECWMKHTCSSTNFSSSVNWMYSLFFVIKFQWSLPFNLGCNLVELLSFIYKSNDDILVTHFLIIKFFLPLASFLFTIYGNVVKSFTHNMCLFIWCLRKRSWIVYTYCALCLGFMFPLYLLSTRALLDDLHRTCTSLFAAFKIAIRSSTKIVHCVCER